MKLTSDRAGYEVGSYGDKNSGCNDRERYERRYSVEVGGVVLDVFGIEAIVEDLDAWLKEVIFSFLPTLQCQQVSPDWPKIYIRHSCTVINSFLSLISFLRNIATTRCLNVCSILRNDS